MNDKTIDWIDTGMPGAFVHFARFKGHDDRFLMIQAKGDVDLALRLRSAGFVRIHDCYFRKQSSTTLSEIKRFFPQARIAKMPAAGTRLSIQDEMPGILTDLPAARRSSAPPSAEDPEFEFLNEQQVKYRPASKSGAPIAAIPVDLARGTQAALARLTEKYGSVDDWLCRILEYENVEEMWKVLSPEQIDAAALSIDSAIEGTGTICADMTGLGKGRVGAALFRWCALNDRRFVFLTEKANLFTDFVRDIADIGALDLMGTPYLMNDGAKILNQATNEVMFRSLKPAENKKVIASGELPEDTRIVMATYSQFNRKGSAKGEFFVKICQDAHLHEDECHNAAGEDSNTSQSIDAAEEGAASFSYSSATFAKRAASFSAYRKILPPSIATAENLVEVLAAGGIPLLEALSRMLAESGRLIRREHDLSDATIQLITDTARREQHRENSDALAPILSSIARFSMDIGTYLEEKTASEAAQRAKEVWYAVHWGVRFSALHKQFQGCCKIDLAVERATHHMLNGKKPVMSFQNTMQAIIEEVMTDEEGNIRPFIEEEDGTQRRPEFKDILTLLVKRTMTARKKRGQEEPETVEIDDPELVARGEEILELISRFPSLPINPMDEVLLRIEAEGKRLHEKGVIPAPWNVNEISGRSVRITETGAQKVQQPDRNVVVNGFQNGQIDFLALTQAGSTGLSLHHLMARGVIEKQEALAAALEKNHPDWAARISKSIDNLKNASNPKKVRPTEVFASISRELAVLDVALEELQGEAWASRAPVARLLKEAASSIQAAVRANRQRVLMEFQPAADVNTRIQTFGRVKRRGSLTEPEFETLSSGLPSEERLLAAMNHKMEEISANVSGSASAGMTVDVPDPINALGNKIARRVLQENPRIAYRMAISLKIEEAEAEEQLYYVNKLLARLPLLLSDEQDAIYHTFMDSYQDAVDDMALKGMHPTRPRELPGVWNVASREIFAPENPDDGPVFGAPIYLTTIEREEFTSPIDKNALLEIIKARRAKDADAKQVRNQIREHLANKLPDLQRAVLPSRFKSVTAALSSKDSNMVQVVTERVGRIRQALLEVNIGGDISVSDEAGATQNGVVVGFRIPNDVDEYDKPGSYFLEYVLPGDEAPRKVSLATLASDEKFKIATTPPKFKKTYSDFENLPCGRVMRRRLVLDGNPFMAAKMAVENEVGSVTRIHMGGGFTSAVLIPLHKHDMVQHFPGVTTNSDLAFRVIEEGGEIYSNATKRNEGIILERDGPRIRVSIPGKKSLAKLFEIDAITKVTGPFEGDWRGKTAWIDPAQFHDLTQAMATRGYGMNYGGEWRNLVRRLSDELASEEPEEARPAA